jgi:hypothetical protein
MDGKFIHPEFTLSQNICWWVTSAAYTAGICGLTSFSFVQTQSIIYAKHMLYDWAPPLAQIHILHAVSV